MNDRSGKRYYEIEIGPYTPTLRIPIELASGNLFVQIPGPSEVIDGIEFSVTLVYENGALREKHLIRKDLFRA
jgi:hypothetical protein